MKLQKKSDWALAALVVITIISVFSVFAKAQAMDVATADNQTVIAADSIRPTEVVNETEIIETTPEQLPLTWATTDAITFDGNITFESEYIVRDGYLPYAVFTPSTAATNEKTPLIVWLHGSGERGVGQDTFFSRGFPDIMSDWSTEGFNAYVICPQLHNGYASNSGVWCDNSSTQRVKDIVDMAIAEYNVDPERVVICGHSLGAQGTTYIASKLEGYFANVVVLSGYDCWTDISNLKDAPIRAYVGTAAAGEDEASYHYTMDKFAPMFGYENVFTKATSHGNVPYWAFSIDEDGNNRSDLIEWMFANM